MWWTRAIRSRKNVAVSVLCTISDRQFIIVIRAESRQIKEFRRASFGCDHANDQFNCRMRIKMLCLFPNLNMSNGDVFSVKWKTKHVMHNLIRWKVIAFSSNTQNERSFNLLYRLFINFISVSDAGICINNTRTDGTGELCTILVKLQIAQEAMVLRMIALQRYIYICSHPLTSRTLTSFTSFTVSSSSPVHVTAWVRSMNVFRRINILMQTKSPLEHFIEPN